MIPVSAPCGVSCEVCHASVDPCPVLLPVLLFVPLDVDSLVFVLVACVFVSETTAFVPVSVCLLVSVISMFPITLFFTSSMAEYKMLYFGIDNDSSSFNAIFQRYTVS